jgi:hypothetical protein
VLTGRGGNLQRVLRNIDADDQRGSFAHTVPSPCLVACGLHARATVRDERDRPTRRPKLTHVLRNTGAHTVYRAGRNRNRGSL